MNIDLAYELLDQLRKNSQFLTDKSNNTVVRYVEYKNFGFGVSSDDIISLIDLTEKKACFSIKMKDTEYNLADALCLAFHKIDGKDIFIYL